jgi:predicted DNA-binding protein (MmcQ/YjbR family)
MSLEAVRQFCRSLPDVAEDVKWGNDLCFTIGGRMFCVICLEAPHQVAFKCTPEAFAELVEQPGLIPAPYMARAMWVQEKELGAALGRRDREALVKTSYELVRAKLPKRRAAKRPTPHARTSKPSRAGAGVRRKR